MDSPEPPALNHEEETSSTRTLIGVGFTVFAWFTGLVLMGIYYSLIVNPGCDGNTNAAYENTVAAIGMIPGILFAVAGGAIIGWRRWRFGAIVCGILCLIPFGISAISYLELDVHKGFLCL